MIETYTENRNRTVAELRHVLSRTNGSMGEAGSVAWQFTRTAYFSLPASKADFDSVFELAVDGGANDVTQDEDTIEIFGPAESFKSLLDHLRQAKLQPDEAEIRMLPNQEMELDVSSTLQVLRAIEAIEELDDVQNVYSNLKISEEALATLEEE